MAEGLEYTLQADLKAKSAIASALSRHTLTGNKTSDEDTKTGGNVSSEKVSDSFSTVLSGMFNLKSFKWRAPDGLDYYVSVVAILDAE